MTAMGSQRARATPDSRGHMRDNAGHVRQGSTRKLLEMANAAAARLTRGRLRRVQRRPTAHAMLAGRG